MRCLVVKQRLHPRQGIFLNALAAVVLAVVFRLKLIERIDVLLVDNLPDALLFGKLHKPLQRLAEPLPGDGFEDVVERAVADRLAAGVHIAGGSNKNDRAVGAGQHGVIDQRDPFAVGQIVIQQHQLRLFACKLCLGRSQRRGNAHQPQTRMLAYQLRVQLRQLVLVFNNQYVDKFMLHSRCLPVAGRFPWPG